MAQMTLIEGHVLQGRIYGPGAANVPDRFAGEVEALEAVARQRAEAAMREQAATLPAGHPYFALGQHFNQQPPQPEQQGEATGTRTLVTNAYNPYQQPHMDSRSLIPDGVMVSGTPEQQEAALELLNSGGTGQRSAAHFDSLGGGGGSSGSGQSAGGSAPAQPPSAPSESKAAPKSEASDGKA